MLPGRLLISSRRHAPVLVLFMDPDKKLIDRSGDIIKNPLVVFFSDHPRDENNARVEFLPAMLWLRVPCRNPVILEGGLTHRSC